MKYFITGATGFIGGRVTRQLRAAGHEVIALARSPSRAAALDHLGVRVVEGDITDKESLRAPMRGVDGVFHIAGWYRIGVKNDGVPHAVNVTGTRNVLELMKELGTPKGVYTSSLVVNSHTRGAVVDEQYRSSGSFLTAYEQSKWYAHYEVVEPMQQAGLPLVSVLPGLVYGPGDSSVVAKTLRTYLQGRLPVVPKRTAFCFAHVDDVARGIVLAMERGTPGEKYIMGGPPKSFADAMEIIASISGRKSPRLRVEPTILKAMSLIVSGIEWILPVPELYSAEMLRLNAGTTYLGSDAKAQRELGFTTRPLEEGLRETVYFEMKQLGIPIPER